MKAANPRVWMMLGEAQSKCEHIAGVPLRPQVAQELHSLFLSKGVAATTAIEGNTLTEEEVRERIEGKLELPPSKEYLGIEVDNIVEACNAIASKVTSGQSIPLSPELLLGYNKKILQGLALEEGVVPGEIRRHSVGVGRYKCPPADECETLVNLFCEWLNGEDFRPPDLELAIAYGILRAIISHLYIAWIHPFGDGNGRTARLIEFQILLEAGVPAPAAHLLSNHYNSTRTEYYRQLDQASKSGGDVVPFVEYAIRGLIDGLKKQLQLIRNQQLDVTWRNYVYNKFGDVDSEADRRRRNLVLDLSAKGSVHISQITEISPRVARAYAGVTSKTLSRDIADLVALELIGRDGDNLRARMEVVLAFLPARKNNG